MKTITLNAWISFGKLDSSNYPLEVEITDEEYKRLLRLYQDAAEGESPEFFEISSSDFPDDAGDLRDKLLYAVDSDATESMTHEMYENLEADPAHEDTGYGVTRQELASGWSVGDTYDYGFSFRADEKYRFD